jgi:hypothetical protein
MEITLMRKNSMMLIYSDKRYLPAGQRHAVMLAPFWGKNPEIPGTPNNGRFDHYIACGQQYFGMVPLKDADIAVLPGEWMEGGNLPLAHELAAAAADCGKRVVIFFCADSDEDIPVENGVIFRTSFYRSKRKPNEFAMPGWSEDFIERYCDGMLPLRPYNLRPVVGYCGYSFQMKHHFREILQTLFPNRHPVSASQSARRLRQRALDALSQARNLKANFLIREAWWGGAYSEGTFDVTMGQRVRQEYVGNILESDYVLCARGAGNFSYRLYETLSMGRIPVLIDTDCVLPYDHWIDWKQYVVWINQSEISSAAERVAEFHAALSPISFQELQQECRRLWEEWLSPPGFFANFHRHFERI